MQHMQKGFCFNRATLGRRLSSIRGAATLAVLLVTGCTSTKTVTITSEPPGAVANFSGINLQTPTPATQTLKFPSKTDRYNVSVTKPGYKEGAVSIALQPKNQAIYHVVLEKEETVAVELVSYQPVRTETGVKLQLVFSQTRAYIETIEESANVATVTKVTDNQDTRIQIGALVLSPTEDSIVYCLMFQEDKLWFSNLERIQVGSFAKTKVTTGRWFDFFPTVTSDGEAVIFCSNRTSENPILWRIRVNGAGGIERITNTQAEDFGPCVSPEGRVIAYSSNLPRADESQVWTIPSTGGLSTQLREGYNPQISPDGKSILFIRSDRRAERDMQRPVRQIWRMNFDGSGETRLTQDLRYDFIDARWSPDGKHIVFASNEGGDKQNRNNYDIWIMSADGKSPTQLTTNGSRDDSPCFDRSGRRIYFRSNRGGHWNIWSFDLRVPDLKQASTSVSGNQ